MKTILVPTDFSANAQNAVDYAVALAKKEKAKLILIHGFHVEYPTSEIPVAMVVEQISSTQRKAEEKLKKLCKEIESSGKVKCSYMLREGFAVDEVLNAAEKLRSDIIIMGTKGASGIKEVILGSNTARVIERARCPVIAVPMGASFKGIKKIVFSTNYNASDVDALKQVVRIAGMFKSKLVLLHISDEEYTKEAEEGLMEQFKQVVSRKIRYPRMSFVIVDGGRQEKVLQNYVKKNKPDMIAMSTQQRNLLESLFGSSITKKMAYHTSVPLLAFHHKKDSILFT